MSVLNDLDDYKFTTEFQTNPNLVLHRSYKADWGRGRPRVAVVQKWAPQEPPLGAGSLGTVRLETLLGGNGDTKNTYRAVKQLRKMDLKRMKIDFHKELLALTKFSRSKVRWAFLEVRWREAANINTVHSIPGFCRVLWVVWGCWPYIHRHGILSARNSEQIYHNLFVRERCSNHRLTVTWRIKDHA